MSYSPTIEIVAADQLKKQTYRFWNKQDMTFVLDEVVHFERPTLRHKFRAAAKWSRLYDRENTMPKPDLPVGVKSQLRFTIEEAFKVE